MKKFIYILCLLFAGTAFGQSLTVFDIDQSNFPVMKAKFYAFGVDGKQLNNLSPSDFEISENGEPMEVTSVTCPPDKPPLEISSVLTIDISSSMAGWGLLNAKSAATAWINAMPLGQSECAITTFNHKNYFNRDFTTDRQKLLKVLTGLYVFGTTDFDACFLNPMSGALLATKNAKHKKVIVLLTDGYAEGNEALIIQKAKQLDARIFCVTISNPCPEILKNIAEATGGKWFENVSSVDETEDLYKTILHIAQEEGVCEIEWESKYQCENSDVDITFRRSDLSAECTNTYKLHPNLVAKLVAEPDVAHFQNLEIGIESDIIITVSAVNAEFDVTNIISSDLTFAVKPSSFHLDAGDDIELTVTCTPSDSAYHIAEFEFVNDFCPGQSYAVSSYSGNSNKLQGIDLITPNGAEEFIVGSDTLITWDGVLPDDDVLLEYSYDNGVSWTELTNSGTGLSYQWNNIPNTVSNDCLVKVKPAKDNFLKWSSISTNGNSVDFSHDGRMVAVAGQNSVIVINSISGDTVKVLSGNTSIVRSVAWSPDDSKIASGSGSVKIWDYETGTEIHNMSGSVGLIYSVAWSPDGTKVVAGSSNSKATIWDADAGTELLTLSGHGNNISSVDWSPEGDRIVTGGLDKRVKVWDAETGMELSSMGHYDYVYCVAWSPDGSKIVSGSADNTLRIWDASDYEVLEILEENNNWIRSAAWSPNSRQIVSACEDTLKIWDVEKGIVIRDFSAFGHSIFSVDWSPAGGKLVSGSEDGTIQIWSAISGAMVRTFSGHSGNLSEIKWSPDGTKYASCSADKTVKIWDAESGSHLLTLFGHSDYVSGVDWSPDGSKIVSGCWDGSIKIWNSANGIELQSITGHSGSVNCVKWSPDGTKIASGSWDKYIKIWDVADGSELKKLSGIDFINRISWSPDGKKIVAGNSDNSVKIWNVSTRAMIRQLSGHTDQIASVSWSPDGSKIISGSWDKNIIVWAAVSGAKLNTLKEHGDKINGVTWSPDGTKIASGSNDKTIKLWDASSGDVLLTLNGHTNFVSTVHWSPDGKRLASGSTDATVKVWDISDPRLPEDVSDAVFSIVKPKTECVDVEMLEVLVGSTKDSLITAFVENTGSWKFRVDSIYIRGTDASAFSLVSGFPKYEVEANAEHFAEFRFKPTSVKKYKAEIVIITQAETLIQNIAGEGVRPAVKIISDLIDFGKVLVGDTKDTIAVVLKNESSSNSLDISETKLLGPDNIQFKVIGGGAFSLDANAEKTLQFEFTPVEAGRTSGSIGFVYDGVGSPAVTQLFGEGVGSAISSVSGIVFPAIICETSAIDTMIDISNIGDATLTITNIEITGDDASEFALIDPFTEQIIIPGETLKLGIIFNPQSTGSKTANIEITSNAGSASILISALKERIRFDLSSAAVDFGSVEPGFEKDAAIKIINTGTLPITWTAPIDLGDFSIESIVPITTVQNGGESIVTVKFKGGEIGKTYNATYIFTDSCGNSREMSMTVSLSSSTAELLLPYLQAYPGDIIEVPIILNNQNNIAQSGATSLKTDLIFNPTLLYPNDYPIEKIDESTAKITIENLPIDKKNGEELTKIRFKVALGNAETCDLILSEALAVDGTADITSIPGTFTLLGICREGGDRLIKSVPQAGIKSISPNPADNKLNIDFTINESGYTEISIYNILGEKVKTLFSGIVIEPGSGELNSDISELSSGQYLIIVKAGEFVQSKALVIIR